MSNSPTSGGFLADIWVYFSDPFQTNKMIKSSIFSYFKILFSPIQGPYFNNATRNE